MTKKPHYSWFERFGTRSGVLRNFNYKQLPEDYREAIREGITKNNLIIAKVSPALKSRLKRFYKVSSTNLQEKEAVVVFDTSQLKHIKYNRYRPGDTDYYNTKMNNIWIGKTTDKIPLPIVDFDCLGTAIVTEGNHRIRAAYLSQYTNKKIAVRLLYYTREIKMRGI